VRAAKPEWVGSPACSAISAFTVAIFLLWQLAYAELIFIDTLWPKFSGQDFENALKEYRNRERRYGATGG
jgi:undecaprenyl pyrophosphate synthase